MMNPLAVRKVGKIKKVVQKQTELLEILLEILLEF